MVRRSQLSASASPFLGLSLEQDKLREAKMAFAHLSDWTLNAILKRFSYASSWAICATLSEEYGKNKSFKVWPLIGETLARPILNEDRAKISTAFRQTCEKLGLAIDGFDRPVQAFQIHSGVALAQLNHLAEAFLAQEAAIGSPDSSNIVELNRWEDASLNFLPIGIHVLRRAILMDHSAWMASLYVDWRDDPKLLTENSVYYVRHFGHELHKAVEKSKGPPKRVAVPRLVWEEDRPHLIIPKQDQRYKLSIEGQDYRVPAGSLWPLPNPIPPIISWQGENPGELAILTEDEFMIFDVNTREHAAAHKKASAGKKSIRVAAATAVIVSKEDFSVDGVQAKRNDLGLYFAQVDLRTVAVELEQKSEIWSIYGTRRPQINLVGKPIAKGKDGPHLYGPETIAELDFGRSELIADHTDGSDREAFVAVEHGDYTVQIRVLANGQGIAELCLSELAQNSELQLGCDPALLSLTLMRSHGSQNEIGLTRFKRPVIVWFGFQEQDNLHLRSLKAPQNFAMKNSQHVYQDDQGMLHLDRHGDYFEATVAFEIAKQDFLFSLKSANLVAVLERVDGSRVPWRLGNVIIKGTNTIRDTLVINSPDRNAKLRIGTKRIDAPFLRHRSFPIPISTLDGGDIYHDSSQELPTLIATVESASEPLDLDLQSWEGETDLSGEMGFPIGGLSIRLETEDGKVDFSEISEDNLPAEKPKQFWLERHRIQENKFQIVLNGKPFAGLVMISIRIRPSNRADWSQLCGVDAEKDRYVFPMKGKEEADNSFAHLEKVHSWVSQSYASRCWNNMLGQPLKARWRELIRMIANRPGGKSRLLLLAVRDDEPDWIPMHHIIQECPTLFAEPPLTFHAFSQSSGPEKALRLLAKVDQPFEDIDIDLPALAAFENSSTAQKLGEKLRNFNPSKLPIILSSVQTRPKEWLGAKALSINHMRAGIKLLRDRIDDHGLLDATTADRMDPRYFDINRTARVMDDHKLSNRCLSANDENDVLVPLVEKALLGFAFASRNGAEQVNAIIKCAAAKLEAPEYVILRSIGEMIFLGRELFIFHLIATEIERRSRA
ncbi:MAG: hypothetical protein OXC63_13085 [Aestuariivita sp.]|nr:hypothetical protein [Aestuariivita sp.]MCY4347285.1 hypothetical protein [Aestuariivita sp.]